jgi:hypothetical protein
VVCPRLLRDFVQGLAPRHLLAEVGVSALRAIAFQQFEFQRWSRHSILRQYFIFQQLPTNHRLVRANALREEVTFSELVVASYLIGAFVTKNPGKTLSALQVHEGQKWFPKDKLRTVIQLYSATVEELRTTLHQDQRKQISVLSALHRPPFRTSPLLKLKAHQYAVWSTPLLLTALGDVVYQSLKASGRADLIAEYGKVFEQKCVSTAVARLSQHVVSEQELRAAALGELVVDFAVFDETAFVLIESKLKDADEATQSSLEPSVIGDRFKSSVVKAIEQGFSTAVRVAKGLHKHSGLEHHAEPFLLIVTTDQHYLVSGRAFERHGGEQRLAQLEAKFGGKFPIPLENIVLLSADGLDRLVASCEAGMTSVFEFVKQVRDIEKSEDMSKKVLASEQLLRPPEDLLPSYLAEAEQHWIAEILGKYQRVAE